MKSFKLSAIALAISVAAVSGAIAADTNGATPPKDPARKAAHKECASSVAKGANGKPEHKAMRDCMEQKGFKPPAKHEHKGEAPPAEQQGNSATPPLPENGHEQ